MDFGALPPEINSGRIYSGPGSGPMLAAASSWDAVAAELNSTASSYDSVIAGLTGEAWSGPTAASMASAAALYQGWMATTAGVAEQAATQARAAAAAYDAALTASVPPPVIATNRSLLLSLIASNILGQNTAAIAATEAHYAEMWAQDATAMYGYAGASAGATRLTPFSPAPATTSPSGLSGQAAAVAHAAAGTGAQGQSTLTQLISLLPQTLQTLAGSVPAAQADPVASLLSVLDSLAGPLGPTSLFGIGGVPYLLAIQCVLLPMNGSNVVASVVRAQKMAGDGTWVPGGLPPGAITSDAGTRLVGAPVPSTPMVSAGAGRAAAVGRMSVPQSWVSATPMAKTVAAVVPNAGPGAVSMVAADAEGGMLSDLALSGLAGRALGVTGGAASRAAGGATGLAAASKPAKPTQATIIVIPPSAED